jgi:transcriptional regulator with XRE-family HTH domain
VPYDPDRVVTQLGKQIAELRRARGLSQGALAEKIRSTPQWVSQLERGTRSPTVHTLCKIANALDVTLGELLSAPAVRKGRRADGAGGA